MTTMSSAPRGRRSRAAAAIAAVLLVAIVVVAVGWILAGSVAAWPEFTDNAGGAAIASDGQPNQVSVAPVGTVSSAPSNSPPDVDPTHPGGMPAEQLFGFTGHLMWHGADNAFAELDLLAQDGMGVVRFDVAWRQLEPRPGTYQGLDKLDRIVDRARSLGIWPVITIIETPTWANGDKAAFVPPDDPADYARFAGYLASRYAGRVLAWEIWNEPDLELFWKPIPDVAAYSRLLIAASAAIREADPSAVILGGSVAFGNMAFVRDMYANGAGGTFDGLAVHPYTLTHAPDDESDRFHSLTAILDDARATTVAAGEPDVGIWVTELGWATVGVNSVSPALRDEYLARAVAIVRERPWVGALTIYTINTDDSQRYGLSTAGNRSSGWESYVNAVKAVD